MFLRTPSGFIQSWHKACNRDIRNLRFNQNEPWTERSQNNRDARPAPPDSDRPQINGGKTHEKLR
jgi:hypothetical protein